MLRVEPCNIVSPTALLGYFSLKMYILMQICKNQQANIIYVHQSVKGGGRSFLVNIILNMRFLIPKVSGLLKVVVSQKKIW